MEDFPFQEFVGLIVFVIVVIAQFWTKLRTGKPMPGTGEPEPEFEFPDFDDQKPGAPGPAPAPSAPAAPRLDDILREALGLPSGPKPSPDAPPVTRAQPASPPVLTRAPTVPQSLPPQHRTTPTAPPPMPPMAQPYGGEPETGGVLASLKRLEQETDFVRARLKAIGRMEVSAGVEAEARMRQRLAKLTSDMDHARTSISAPHRKSPIGQLLVDRTALRRAIVLNEILGPPRSLNPHG